MFIATLALALQACAPCTPVFLPSDTLGADTDPASPGLFAQVLRTGDGGFLVSSETMGPQVLVYDRSGRFVRVLGRLGSGPGEFRRAVQFARGHGEIAMLELRSPRVHVFDDELRYLHSFNLPGVGWSMAATPGGGWVAAATGDAGPSGDAPALFAVDSVGTVLEAFALGPPQELSRGGGVALRQVAVGPDGTVYSATWSGRVEVYSPAGALVASHQLEGPGISAPMPTGPGQPLPTFVTGIALGDDGLVWVFLAGAGGQPVPRERPITPEEMFDTSVRLLRVAGGRLEEIGSASFDAVLMPMGGGWAYDMFTTDAGDRRVRVGRLGVEGR